MSTRIVPGRGLGYVSAITAEASVRLTSSRTVETLKSTLGINYTAIAVRLTAIKDQAGAAAKLTLRVGLRSAPALSPSLPDAQHRAAQILLSYASPAPADGQIVWNSILSV